MGMDAYIVQCTWMIFLMGQYDEVYSSDNQNACIVTICSEGVQIKCGGQTKDNNRREMRFWNAVSPLFLRFG